MKWINAKQRVTVTIYDEEHEEHIEKIMTVEEMLDTYTNEGCPTMYVIQERKTGKWIPYNEDKEDWLRSDGTPIFMHCSECHSMVVNYFAFSWNYCPECGSKNGR